MLEAKIIKTGRGPEIAGTRITVYDVIEYYKAGRHRDMIADTLELRNYLNTATRPAACSLCDTITTHRPVELIPGS
jgi:hypothetical protein